MRVIIFLIEIGDRFRRGIIFSIGGAMDLPERLQRSQPGKRLESVVVAAFPLAIVHYRYRWFYTSQHHRIVARVRSVMPDLVKLNLTDQVIRADEFFFDIPG